MQVSNVHLILAELMCHRRAEMEAICSIYIYFKLKFILDSLLLLYQQNIYINIIIL